MKPRYIFQNGVMKLNPEFQASDQTSVANPTSALAIVSSTEEVIAATEAQASVTGEAMSLAPATVQAMQLMQEPAYIERFKAPQALDGGQLLEGLTHLFSTYEIPIGLINKLMELSNYHIDFIIDDSGSMGHATDVKFKDATSYVKKKNTDKKSGEKLLTRWQEVEDRLHIMIDMLQFVPVQSILIHFMHNPLILNLVQQGKTPQEFAAAAHEEITKAFAKFASGHDTPIYRCLSDAFTKAKDYTLHFLLTDGEPTDRSVDDVVKLVKERKHPSRHPITFISCTDKDDEIEWIKKLDTAARFVAELDDFKSVRAEISKRQGPVFPYTRGFWLLSHLVTAINPYDLDALHEKYPLTKKTMNELLGRVISSEEYRHYFNHHPLANKYVYKFDQFAREDIITQQILKPEKAIVKPHAPSGSGFWVAPQLPAPAPEEKQTYSAPAPGY